MMNIGKGIRLTVVLIALALGACKGKQTQTDTPIENQGAAAQTTTPTIDATPMSFDAAGSDSGKIAGLKTVFFAYDKSVLDETAKKDLQANADWLKKNGNVKLQIEGHCDNRGTIEYNLALGERRANTTKSYLVSLGIPTDRLSTISYGEEKPLVQGDNEAAWAKNRRANFLPLQ
jgi:peptidoglycan-associated lipoprotein